MGCSIGAADKNAWNVRSLRANGHLTGVGASKALRAAKERDSKSSLRYTGLSETNKTTQTGMGDIQSWWDNLPVFTKYLFVGSFGLTLAANFGLVNPMLLILDWHSVVTQFQVWRLVTCFLFHGALGFPFLINMLFLYVKERKRERES